MCACAFRLQILLHHKKFCDTQTSPQSLPPCCLFSSRCCTPHDDVIRGSALVFRNRCTAGAARSPKVLQVTHVHTHTWVDLLGCDQVSTSHCGSSVKLVFSPSGPTVPRSPGEPLQQRHHLDGMLTICPPQRGLSFLGFHSSYTAKEGANCLAFFLFIVYNSDTVISSASSCTISDHYCLDCFFFYYCCCKR